MKILVIGNGFLGQEYASMGYETICNSRWDVYDLIDQVKLSFFSEGKEYIDKINNADAIINCVGMSDTRLCETNFEDAYFANALVPKILSKICNLYNKKFVHISTGCLYDEIGRPCTEEDFLAAHCAYTVTKYAGEKYCAPRDLILRPRLLFSDKKQEKRNNLVQKLLKFNTFVDEFNSVTWNKTIVEATIALLEADQVGVFNVANEGIHTIYDIATKMLGKTGEKMSGAELRKSQGLHLVNNVMDLTKLKKFYQPPTVEEAIKTCFEKLK